MRSHKVSVEQILFTPFFVLLELFTDVSCWPVFYCFTLAALLFTLKAILRFAEGFRISLEQNIANWRHMPPSEKKNTHLKKKIRPGKNKEILKQKSDADIRMRTSAAGSPVGCRKI